MLQKSTSSSGVLRKSTKYGDGTGHEEDKKSPSCHVVCKDGLSDFWHARCNVKGDDHWTTQKPYGTSTRIGLDRLIIHPSSFLVLRG